MTDTPHFIVFEGIDGSGKSTQCTMVMEFLKEAGISSIKLSEPSQGIWGKKIREILKGTVIPEAEEQLELFLLDRKDDVEKNILPAMNGKKSVIMDRYYYSNAAYQGAMGLSPQLILQKNREQSFPEPDRVYFIDITPENAIERITERNNGKDNGTEIFEKKSFLHRVKEIYHSIADDKFCIINGSLSIEEVFEQIKSDIKKLYMLD